MAMEWFTEQFLKNDKDSKVAKDYWIEERKFSLQDAKAFGVGYAPVDRFALAKHLEQKGFSEKVLDKSGLFNEKKQSGQFASRFCGRLMIPIREKLDACADLLPANSRLPQPGEIENLQNI